jgi:hypothetical protein
VLTEMCVFFAPYPAYPFKLILNTMKKLLKPISLLSFCLIATPMASAHTIIYMTNLSGPNEAPPNASPGIGNATVTLDLDLGTLRLQSSFSGLTGNVTAAHIHGATAVAGTGTAGVITQTPSFSGFPLGVTSGMYDMTFDMTVASSYNAAYITGNGGTVATAYNALQAALNDGKTYLNIHTSAFPGGEIRGFLVAVPEPGSVSLASAAGLILFARRRRS